MNFNRQLICSTLNKVYNQHTSATISFPDIVGQEFLRKYVVDSANFWIESLDENGEQRVDAMEDEDFHDDQSYHFLINCEEGEQLKLSVANGDGEHVADYDEDEDSVLVGLLKMCEVLIDTLHDGELSPFHVEVECK